MTVERIAFLWRGAFQPVYWRWIFIAMGALVFVLVLIALRAGRGKRLLPLALILPLTGAGTVYAARLVHWYCRSEDYAGLAAAMKELTRGGFSLAGGLAGGLAVIGLLGLVRLIPDLPDFLDGLGIAVGRLGDLYGLVDHGRIVFEEAARQRLPLASPVYNPVAGTYEWRLATFCLQSLWVGGISLLVLAILLFRRRRGTDRPGRAAVLVLTLYCLGQILFESTRYDALFLRSNGFVSMEQILCALVLTGLLLTGVRTADRRNSLWRAGLYLAGLGLAGFMEYYVQRHGGAYAAAYSGMAAGLGLMLLGLRLPAEKAEKTPAEPK